MINCTARTVAELFALGVFEPASVQREYQWTTKECSELFEDLAQAFADSGLDPDDVGETSRVDKVDPSYDDASSEPPLPVGEVGPLLTLRSAKPRPKGSTLYFLGPMVLFPAPRAVKRHFIYDGLQRFTTLSILMSVLRDSFVGTEADYWLGLGGMLRTNDTPPAPRVRVRTPGGSLAAITGSLGGARMKRGGGASEADMRMRDAVKLFFEKIAAWTDKRRIAFAGFIKNNTVVAVTIVSDRALAYKIFVTANDRGLNLQVGDIIKGGVVDLVADRKGAVAGEKVAEKWTALQRRLRPHFDLFLRSVDFLEHRQHRPTGYGEPFLDDLAERSADEIETWVGDALPKQVDRFLVLLRSEREDVLVGSDVLLRRLYFLQDKGWYPVAMALHSVHGMQPENWTWALSKLVGACYTLELLDWPPEKRAQKYAIAIEQISAGLNPFQVKVRGGAYGAFYSSEAFRQSARSALLSPITDESRRGALVRFLETLYWPGQINKIVIRRSVEHVLPRAAKGRWTELFSEEERDFHTNLLGNFCMIEAGLNHEIGNQQFEEKRKAFLALDETHKSAHEVAVHVAWTPEIVQERTRALAAKASQALGLGAISQ